ncbi:hypothetical protein Btru_003228 [Bulinus truncatus]|nr:hypothetical protein Btru_003228 [Bulinus truncatus]
MEVKCHMCDEIFPNRTSRTQHYKLFHQSDILKCLHCTHMFSSQEELAAHMKKHAMYKKKQCTICGKFFSRLEKHVIIHKSKSEIDESLLFVCDKCPRKFSHRSSFQRHLSTHSLDKPYQCPNCPRTFADCSVLRKHIQRHTFLMPYQCESSFSLVSWILSKETNLLYEIDKSCGLIGLTIDGNLQYVLFQHSIKVELTLKVNSKSNDGDGEEILQLQAPVDLKGTRCSSCQAEQCNCKSCTLKQESTDASPAVSDKLHDRAESDYDISEEEQIVASTDPESQKVIDCEYCFQSFGTRLEFFNHRRSKNSFSSVQTLFIIHH